MDRAHRAVSQRMYLIGQMTIDPARPLDRWYVVQGTTGNAYKVNISPTRVKCNCPDGNQWRRCKHIFFLLIRVFRLPLTQDSIIFKSSFTEAELQAIFQNAVRDPNIEASADAQARYKAAVSTSPTPPLAADAAAKRSKHLDEMCPICYEDMKDSDGPAVAAAAALATCDVCSHSVHRLCVQAWWSGNSTQRGHCPTCRGYMSKDPKYTKSAVDDYINVGTPATE